MAPATRPSPFASARLSVRESTTRARELVEQGALDSTADGIEPVTEEEVAAMRATIPDRRRP